MLTRLSVDSLQWAIGLFCGFIGAFVLVAPHQFLFLPFAGTASHLVWWGLAALLSGAALLAVPVVRPGALATAAAHAGAGIVLLFLAGAFYGAGAWTGTIVYCVLGLGTGLAGLLPGAHRPAPAAAGDLLGLLMGGASMLAGLVALTIPRLYLVPFFDPSRHLLVWLGAGLLTSGPVLAGVQVRPVRRRLLRLAHLYAGLALFAYGLLVALPARAWTGVAVYCGGGLTVAALPWLRRWLERAEASTLQTRLALALALASTGALILAVAVVTTQEEQLAAEQAVSLQQIEADAIAQNIADFLEFNGARAAAVAATAGRAPMTPEAQGPYLESTGRIHPDVAAFATLGPAGEPLAATGGLNLPPGLARALALEIGGQAQPVLVLHVIEMRGRTRLLLSTPIPRPQGRRAGVLVSMLDPDSLSRRLSRPGSAITLADGHGRTIAVLDSGVDPRPPPPAGRQPAPLPRGWDADVAVGRLPRAGNLLAAFAAVPRIGWAVAVERPRAAALAGVRRGRDMAFLLLLLCAGLAVCAGVVTARRIARPLGTLADAVDQLTAGNRWAPLPPSNISEVARLSAAFGEMRDRLAERTAESERLA
ncbi:MAG TPA: cache and HAMP domain-containing protein, partial [Thermoanaerobaculia bacterium]|nr:cache and HAMP domain-containing protein [Thermoanaerobaculia bacterium]